MTMRRCLAPLIILLALTIPVLGQEDTRTFHLGFTPFPYAISLEAVTEVYARISQDADLIAHHFDNGIPWPEALAGAPYSSNIRDDWALRQSLTLPGHKVLVTVTPINFARDGLALYRGAQDDMPLPAPFDRASFDDPEVIQAFLNYAESVIDFFQPDYFVMGIEVNLLMKQNPTLWDAYLVLHRTVYQMLKISHPDLPLMVSLTGHDLLAGYTDANHTDQMRALADIIDYTDYLALSVYPYMTRYMTTSLPEQIFDELATLTDKPLAIAETGYPAQSFHVAMGLDLQFDSDASKQADYINLLLTKAQAYNFRFVVNFVLRDYDALWQALGGREDLTIIWRDTGLYDEKGQERPALAIWREWLGKPVG